ncbi:MAG: energy transducer TonB [Hyphomicrobiales bacterium]
MPEAEIQAQSPPPPSAAPSVEAATPQSPPEPDTSAQAQQAPLPAPVMPSEVGLAPPSAPPKAALVAEEPPRDEAAAARLRAQRRLQQAKRELEAKADAAQAEAKERAARGAQDAKRRAEAKAADASAAKARAQTDLVAVLAYHGIVIGHLAGFKRYPPAARARGAQGNPVVAFSVDASGRVVSVSLTRGSGDTDIDAEIVAMVHRASPFPAPPPGAPHAFSAGVNFRLQ